MNVRARACAWAGCSTKRVLRRAIQRRCDPVRLEGTATARHSFDRSHASTVRIIGVASAVNLDVPGADDHRDPSVSLLADGQGLATAQPFDRSPACIYALRARRRVSRRQECERHIRFKRTIRRAAVTPERRADARSAIYVCLTAVPGCRPADAETAIVALFGSAGDAIAARLCLCMSHPSNG